MTLTRLPSRSICARSALSKDMTPVAGMKLTGLRSIGPARPSTPRGPSMNSPAASMRTSSIVSPSITTAGTSALTIRPQRAAAISNAACCAALSPPVKRTSMLKPCSGGAVAMAAT